MKYKHKIQIYLLLTILFIILTINVIITTASIPFLLIYILLKTLSWLHNFVIKNSISEFEFLKFLSADFDFFFINIFLLLLLLLLFIIISFIMYYLQKTFFFEKKNTTKTFVASNNVNSRVEKIKNFFYYFLIKIDKKNKNFNKIDEQLSNTKFSDFLSTNSFINKIGNFNYSIVIENNFYTFRSNIYFPKLNELKVIFVLICGFIEFLFIFFALYKLILLHYKFDFLIVLLNFNESFLPYNRLNLKGFIDFSTFICISFVFSVIVFLFYLWLYHKSSPEIQSDDEDFWFYNFFLPNLRVLFYIFISFLFFSFTGIAFVNLIYLCTFEILEVLRDFFFKSYDFFCMVIDAFQASGGFSPFLNPSNYFKMFHYILTKDLKHDPGLLVGYKQALLQHYDQTNSIIYEQELWKYELLMDIRKKNRFLKDYNDLIFYNELVNKNFFGYGVKLDNVYLSLDSTLNSNYQVQYFRQNGEIMFDPLYNPLMQLSINLENETFFSYYPEINVENLRFDTLELGDFLDIPQFDPIIELYDNYDIFFTTRKNLKQPLNNIIFDVKYSDLFFSKLFNFLNIIFPFNFYHTEFHNYSEKVDFFDRDLDFEKINDQIKFRPFFKNQKKIDFYDNFFIDYKKNSLLNRFWYEDFFFNYLTNEAFLQSDNYFFDSYIFFNIQKINDYFENITILKPFSFNNKRLDSFVLQTSWPTIDEIIDDYFLLSENLEDEDEYFQEIEVENDDADIISVVNETNGDFDNEIDVSTIYLDQFNNVYNEDEAFANLNDNSKFSMFYGISFSDLESDFDTIDESNLLLDDLTEFDLFFDIEEDMEEEDDIDQVEDVAEAEEFDDFYLIAGESDDIGTILGINAFFDINKFLNIYSVNDLIYTNNYRDDIIYFNGFGNKINFEIQINDNNFSIDLFNDIFIFENVFSSYYVLEAKIQNFVFFQNTIFERYIYKHFGASIVTEGLQYELIESFSKVNQDVKKIMLVPSLTRINPVFFQTLYSFDWRFYKEKFIEFPFNDYIFPYKKYKFFGLDKLFFDWANDGTVLKNHESDFNPSLSDYLDDQEVAFLEYPQIYFYHRDLNKSFMLADYNSALILKDYQNGLYYDKKNYFLNYYLFNLIIYNIDLAINNFIDFYSLSYENFLSFYDSDTIYDLHDELSWVKYPTWKVTGLYELIIDSTREQFFQGLKEFETFYETPMVGAATLIYPVIKQDDVFFFKRALSDNYLRPTSFELSSIFERTNIKMMDFINRLIFMDFEKRGKLFINDLFQNNDFFDFLRIFVLLRGYDPWYLYKINSLFDLNQLDLILNDDKLFNFEDDDDDEEEKDESFTREAYFLARKFNFHVLDNLDFLLFPYRNHYIFPIKFYFLKSDLINFLKQEGIYNFVPLRSLNDINSLQQETFDLFSFLTNFLQQDENEHENLISVDELITEPFFEEEEEEDEDITINDKFDEIMDEFEMNEDLLYDDLTTSYNQFKKPFFENFFVKKENNFDEFLLKKKFIKSRKTYKTFAPKFEIGFPNNRNFYRSIIFKSFANILFVDPYLFGLYNFPYDNAYSFFWVNFLRATFLKNQFIAQLRSDKIFSSEFMFENPSYKRVSFYYILLNIKNSPEEKIINFLYRKKLISDALIEHMETFQTRRYELFYPIINWFSFNDWKISRFRKYSFSYFKNFRIFFDSSKRSSIFFDRQGNISFNRFPSKTGGKLYEEYDSVYVPTVLKKEKSSKLRLKYPDFFTPDGYVFFFQSFFSYFLDKLNITKFLIYIVDFADIKIFNHTFKNFSATYEILVYKRRQKYARFLNLMRDAYWEELTSTSMQTLVHDFEVFHIFYSMENITQNFNTILSQVNAMHARSFHFRYLINKIKPSPELIIFRNNDIRLRKIVNQIFFFKFLTNFKNKEFWDYFFKQNYIDTRLFNIPIDYNIIEDYPLTFYIFEPVNRFSIKFDVCFYENVDALLIFNLNRRFCKEDMYNHNSLFLYPDREYYKWTYFGKNWYGYMPYDFDFYERILTLNAFPKFRDFGSYVPRYFNHAHTFKNTPNQLLEDGELVNVTPLAYFKMKYFYNLNDEASSFELINTNFNMSFENYYQSISIYKYLSRIASFNNLSNLNFVSIYTPLEYEIYKKEKFLSWLKFNKFRRILKHYNLYLSNYSYFAEFDALSEFINPNYNTHQELLNENMLSDYFSESNDEEPEDRFLLPREKFYIPFRHEYWYFTYPEKIFPFNPLFLQQFFDVLDYYKSDVFNQTIKVLDLKIKYDIYKIRELEHIVDILYTYTLNNKNSNKQIYQINKFNFSLFFNNFHFKSYILFILNCVDLDFCNNLILNLYNQMFLSNFKNFVYFLIFKSIFLFIKFFYYFFKFFIFLCLNFYYFLNSIIIEHRFFSNINEHIHFLNYSFLFFWIHFFIFPIWLFFFFFFTDLQLTYLKPEPRHLTEDVAPGTPLPWTIQYHDDLSVDKIDRMYYKDFIIQMVPYTKELDDFILTNKRQPELLEIEKLLKQIKLKERLQTMKQEESFFIDQTILLRPSATRDNLIIFYVFRKEPITGSFVFFKFLQHRQVEKALRHFIQLKLFEEKKFIYKNNLESQSYDNKFYFPTRIKQIYKTEEEERTANAKLRQKENDIYEKIHLFSDYLRVKNKKIKRYRIFKKILFPKYSSFSYLKKNKRKGSNRFETLYKDSDTRIIRNKKINFWQNTVTTKTYKNEFTFFGFLYKASIIYFEFFFVLYLTCLLFIIY